MRPRPVKRGNSHQIACLYSVVLFGVYLFFTYFLTWVIFYFRINNLKNTYVITSICSAERGCKYPCAAYFNSLYSKVARIHNCNRKL
jgi:hypothetical protein